MFDFSQRQIPSYKGANMKKKLLWGLLLIVSLIVLFTSKSSVTLQLPFMQSDVVNIEMYHYEGVPAAEECKIVTVREDINTLHKELQNIKIRDRKILNL